MTKLPFPLLPSLLLLLIFGVAAAATSPRPQPLSALEIPMISQKGVGGCSYTVVVKTSCSSNKLTRDQISVAFGDAYGNQVYAPRLDDPSSGTFERCSTDTFKITGPCTYEICYFYLLRMGRDGWKPEQVKVYSPNSRAVTFYYDMFLPNGVWYGFNLCSGSSAAAA
ncbi:hypothetical protein EJ110_NYTH28249 [Nymphaea thermarum]|nr:hypothetical protein EJ110_NYTH28249 [Nymphaea thermarum]